MAVEPTVTRAAWPGYRVRVGGTDITFSRANPTGCIPQDWANVDPGGHDAASFLFPKLLWSDVANLGTGATAWWSPGVYLTVETLGDHKLLYRGSVDTMAPGPDGLVMTCDGDVIGPLSTQNNNFLLGHHLEDSGLTIAKIVSAHTNVHVDLDSTTGFEVDRPGSINDSRWARILDLLSISQRRNGDQITLLPDDDDALRYVLGVRDMTTAHYHATFGAPGVEAALTWDVRNHVTAWYGEGQRNDGGRWYNLKFPFAGQVSHQDFPNTGSRPMVLGDTNADTDNGQGITALVRTIARYGVSLIDTGGNFTEAVQDAVESLQDDAGLPVTGEVDEATWELMFGTPHENQTLYGAQRTPLIIQENTREWDRDASGALRGRNADYDASVRQVTTFIPFGTGIDKAPTARDWCRGQKARQAAFGREWDGTVTFQTDPAECHRFEMRSGKNILDSTSGLLFHISRVSVDVQGGTVTCDVSTHGRDYLDLATLMLRNREARQHHAHRASAQLARRSGQSQDMQTGYDYEGAAGFVPDTEIPGGEWSVLEVFMGAEGQVGEVYLETEDPTEFVAMLLGREVSATRLNALMPFPLTHRGDADAWVADDNLYDILYGRDGTAGDLGFAGRKAIMYAVGTPSGEDDDGNTIPALPGGYSPHSTAAKPNDATLGSNLTGRWEDDAGFGYNTNGGCVAYFAVWPRDTTKFVNSRFKAAWVDGGM